MTITKLTAQTFKDNCTGNIYDDVKFAQSFYPPYPDRPTKPRLLPSHNSIDAKRFAENLAQWEIDNESYKAAMDAYRDEAHRINLIIEAYIKEESGFNTYIPDDKKAKVWSKAWQDGHSNGYSEVYGCLCGLVDLFQ